MGIRSGSFTVSVTCSRSGRERFLGVLCILYHQVGPNLMVGEEGGLCSGSYSISYGMISSTATRWQ